MFKNLFANGKSWRSTVAGIIVLVGGIGALSNEIGIDLPKSVRLISALAALAGTTFGFSQTKDSQVTGVPGAVNPRYEAVTPMTEKDAETIAKPE